MVKNNAKTIDFRTLFWPKNGPNGGYMRIDGFHRGAHHWVADIQINGRDRVAYYDRAVGRWYCVAFKELDVNTLGEFEIELTYGLKKYLESIGVINKGEPNGNE